MKEWLVILPWTEYHSLVSSPVGIIVAPIPLPGNPFDIALQSGDACYGPLSMKEGVELQKAFRDLCHADWSPNQNVEEAERNSLVSIEARRTINKYSIYPGS